MIDWPEVAPNFEETCDRVQAWAQSIFTWRDDSQVWDMPEFWATADEMEQRFTGNNIVGDCDDYASLCVHALRRMAIEARYLTCWTETGGYHCICLARENGKALVLDNRFKVPMPRQALYLIGYKFDRMSGVAPGDDWALA